LKSIRQARNSSGSFATLAAIRRASSFGHRLPRNYRALDAQVSKNGKAALSTHGGLAFLGVVQPKAG